MHERPHAIITHFVIAIQHHLQTINVYGLNKNKERKQDLASKMFSLFGQPFVVTTFWQLLDAGGGKQSERREQ